MAKPRNNRIEKATKAAQDAATQLARHRECDSHGLNLKPQVHSNEHFTIVTVDMLFNKTGTEIFENPHKYDQDYDYPILVGHDIISSTLTKAAREAKLKFTKDLKVYISPSEKGWVDVGLQFIHQPS